MIAYFRDRAAFASQDEIGLDDFRRTVLNASALGCIAATFVLMIVFQNPGEVSQLLAPTVVALYCLAGATYALSRWSPLAGSLALVAGLVGLTLAALWEPHLAWLVYLAPLAVLFVSTFCGLYGGLASALLLSLGLVGISSLGGPLDVAALRTLAVLTWANLALAWLAAEPIRLALRWSWSEFRRAEREADRARRHRAELAQLVKSLRVAQDRLVELNKELDRSRRAAEEARRLKAEFAAAVSHELRTPLNLIIGFAEMMSRSRSSAYDEQLPQCYEGDVETISENACHISDLIDDILDLSQIDAHRMALQKQPTSIVEVVNQAAGVVAARFETQGLSLSVAAPDDLPLLNIDPTRIRQVVLNLLVNALRFTEEGGVAIRVWPDGRDVVVSVADTGVGIHPDDLPFVFEEFRQTAEPGRRRGGSGLGLTVSRRFAEMHGGNLWVESKFGEGSTFHLSLPTTGTLVTRPYLASPSQAVLGEPGGSQPTVIVLDELGEPTKVLQRYLDDYTVVQARDPVEVLQAAQSKTPHAVILGAPGSQAIWRRVRSTQGHLGGVALVTCPMRTASTVARELHVAHYLVKPITHEKLRAVLQSLPLRGPINRVLVTEDDERMARLLQRMIAQILDRCEVRTARDGIECLEFLEGQQPDVLLLDLLLPRLDGYGVLARMRLSPALAGIPVVVITGKSNREEAIVAGAVTITRQGGLSVGETVRCLKSALDALSAGIAVPPGEP